MGVDRARRRPRPARLNTADTVRLRLDAWTEPAIINLEARNGLEAVLITTPLTGWFGCAGEQGTGVAVLLDLVERFADRPLLVLATGGHELDISRCASGSAPGVPRTANHQWP